MYIIPQIKLFDYTLDEELGDLQRLINILKALPDNKIINKLETIRGKGRNEYPVAAMWNAFIASYVFQHPSISALIRELSRNIQLRKVCGFMNRSGISTSKHVPTDSAFSNFFKNLKKCSEEIDEIFNELVKFMYDNLENFGQTLAIDGKALNSYANTYSKKTEKDGRRELDANYGIKEYHYSDKEGEKKIKKSKWFGFKLHLICCADYELPVGYEITRASENEKNIGLEMIEQIPDERMEKCEYVVADKGYDSSDFLKKIESKGSIPIVDIREFKKGETSQYKETDLVYNGKGEVFYVNEKAENIKLVYKGYDKGTDSLRYGFSYKYDDKRVFRIKREENYRIFNKVARDSPKFKRVYKKRTSVERVNGRIDRDYEFENHTIRGIEKMKLFVGMGLIVMLSMAKSKIERATNQKKLRSLVA